MLPVGSRFGLLESVRKMAHFCHVVHHTFRMCFLFLSNDQMVVVGKVPATTSSFRWVLVFQALATTDLQSHCSARPYPLDLPRDSEVFIVALTPSCAAWSTFFGLHQGCTAVVDTALGWKSHWCFSKGECGGGTGTVLNS